MEQPPTLESLSITEKREKPAPLKIDIPRFWVPKHERPPLSASALGGRPDTPLELEKRAKREKSYLTTVDLLFPSTGHILKDASLLLPLTRALGLPRYFNLALWKKLLQFQGAGEKLEKPSCLGFWYHFLRQHVRGEGEEETHLAFHLLRKTNLESLVMSVARLTSTDTLPDKMSLVDRMSSTDTMSSDFLSMERQSSSGDVDEEILTMEDFEVIVEDVLHNHSSLDFLAQMPIFQARYMDTVVARMMYRKAKWWDGRMTKRQFLKSGIWESVKALEPGPDGNGDVNATRDIFSYKHFYVAYCRFWELDSDHDMVVTGSQLFNYDGGRLTRRMAKRVVEFLGRHPPISHVVETSLPPLPGQESSATMVNSSQLDLEEVKKPAGAPNESLGQVRSWKRIGHRDRCGGASLSQIRDIKRRGSESSVSSGFSSVSELENDWWEDAKLEYRDFVWFILAMEDKSTSWASEFWFKCMDVDGDGVLSMHEIHHFWKEQHIRMKLGRTGDVMAARDNPRLIQYWCGEVWDWTDFVYNITDLVHTRASPCVGKMDVGSWSSGSPLASPDERMVLQMRLNDIVSTKQPHIFWDLCFDLRSYDNHQHRMDPAWREQDDVWCVDPVKGKIKLKGWEKFAERGYEILAWEESQAQQKEQARQLREQQIQRAKAQRERELQSQRRLEQANSKSSLSTVGSNALNAVAATIRRARRKKDDVEDDLDVGRNKFEVFTGIDDVDDSWYD